MEKGDFSRTKALKEVGVSYLGATKQSAKLMYSYNNGVETYGVYLAPATLARDNKHPHINVCPCSEQCAESCLAGAGHNKVAMLAMKGINGLTNIDKARVRKTHLFYDDREKFMRILVSEIASAKTRAEKKGMGFAVRLNCTSDLNPELFTLNGKNILQIFPDVQFYDYTKVPTRLDLINKYPNYFLTYSYDGTHFSEQVAKQFLANGGQVAVVYDVYDENGKQTLPKEWWGYEVKDCNGYDMRYLDGNCVAGLHYHRVGKDYVNGEYKPRNTSFIVREV